jgi:hypothetical protein
MSLSISSMQSTTWVKFLKKYELYLIKKNKEA